MTEEGKIYDFESDWIPCNSGADKRIYFVNKNYDSLFRIIDMNAQRFIFSDVDRVVKITDINKVLVKEDNAEKNMKLYMPIVNRVIDEVKPIEMPYTPEKLKCFIEAFPGYSDSDDILGVLYFQEVESGDMIEAKRFYRMHIMGELGPKFEEINYKIYNELKFKWMNGEKEKKDE